MIVATGIHHKYGKETALRDIDIHIAQGSFVALTGESGSGKSTLLSILSTLLRPTRGEVRIFGKNSKEVGNIDHFRKETIGFVFQMHYLIRYLRIRQNITLAAQKKDQEYIDTLIRYLGIEDIQHKFPHEVSGGQRQRAAIARAMANRPKVVFADEPTGSLDSKNSQKVFALLRDIADKGTTVVVATHDTAIMDFADCIYRVEDGTVSRIG